MNRKTGTVQFDLESTKIYEVQKIQENTRGENETAESRHRLLTEKVDSNVMRSSRPTFPPLERKDNTEGRHDVMQGTNLYPITQGTHEIPYKTIVFKRQKKNIVAVQAVLTEQKRQRHNGQHDEELLAIIYHGYSKLALDDAIRKGRLDTQDIANKDGSPLAADDLLNNWPAIVQFSADDDVVSVLSGDNDDDDADEHILISPRKLEPEEEYFPKSPRKLEHLVRRIRKALHR